MLREVITAYWPTPGSKSLLDCVGFIAQAPKHISVATDQCLVSRLSYHDVITDTSGPDNSGP